MIRVLSGYLTFLLLRKGTLVGSDEYQSKQKGIYNYLLYLYVYTLIIDAILLFSSSSPQFSIVIWFPFVRVTQ